MISKQQLSEALVIIKQNLASISYDADKSDSRLEELQKKCDVEMENFNKLMIAKGDLHTAVLALEKLLQS